jgi:hypothetical protein
MKQELLSSPEGNDFFNFGFNLAFTGLRCRRWMKPIISSSP